MTTAANFNNYAEYLRPLPTTVAAFEKTLSFGGAIPRVAMGQHRYDPHLDLILERGVFLTVGDGGDKRCAEHYAERTKVCEQETYPIPPGHCHAAASYMCKSIRDSRVAVGYALLPRDYGEGLLDTRHERWTQHTICLSGIDKATPTIWEASCAAFLKTCFVAILTKEETLTFADAAIAFDKRHENKPFAWSAGAAEAGTIPAAGIRYTSRRRAEHPPDEVEVQPATKASCTTESGGLTIEQLLKFLRITGQLEGTQ